MKTLYRIMTDRTNFTKKPRTPAEKMREIERRLSALENPHSIALPAESPSNGVIGPGYHPLPEATGMPRPAEPPGSPTVEEAEDTVIGADEGPMPGELDEERRGLTTEQWSEAIDLARRLVVSGSRDKWLEAVEQHESVIAERDRLAEENRGLRTLLDEREPAVKMWTDSTGVANCGTCGGQWSTRKRWLWWPPGIGWAPQWIGIGRHGVEAHRPGQRCGERMFSQVWRLGRLYITLGKWDYDD